MSARSATDSFYFAQAHGVNAPNLQWQYLLGTIFTDGSQGHGLAQFSDGREKVSTLGRDNANARRGRAVGLVKTPAQNQTTTSLPWTSGAPKSPSQSNCGPFADGCSLSRAERRSEQNPHSGEAGKAGKTAEQATGGGRAGKACSVAGGDSRDPGSTPGASTIQWVSTITGGLPDSDTTVLIHCPISDDPVWMGYHDGETWRSVDGEALDRDFVDHWAHLPDPPALPWHQEETAR